MYFDPSLLQSGQQGEREGLETRAESVDGPFLSHCLLHQLRGRVWQGICRYRAMGEL